MMQECEQVAGIKVNRVAQVHKYGNTFEKGKKENKKHNKN